MERLGPTAPAVTAKVDRKPQPQAKTTFGRNAQTAMDVKKQRQHLQNYTQAARQIELAGVAIAVLEGMNTREALQAIKILQRGQQRQLTLLDAAAAKLGAPYGA